ncbi:MAG: EAL domain-containing protein [Clostridia bacterium]|nr:EAL domain-containing protein [Clostridia bacterium]
MIRELLALFKGNELPVPILEFLNNSSYDEMLGIDLGKDRYKFMYNIDGKYHIPSVEGSFRGFYDYAVDHLIHPDDRQTYADALNPDGLMARLASSDTPGLIDFQFRIRNLDGDWRWVEQVSLGGPPNDLPDGLVYCYIYDIQNIKDREAGVTRVRSGNRVQRDTLTGLLRGNDFYAAAARLMADSDANWQLLVIDLEQFKLFNEWYGRKAGDMVLARIGAGLQKDAEEYGGLAGYMGNDDFCLLVPAASIQVESLYEKIHGVIVRYGVSIGFLPSFGISYSNGNTGILDLFDQASLACQQAKRDFKERICTFDHSMYNKTAEDYRILSEFQDALKNREITFYLQPQCRASRGTVVGAESLARWRKPDGRMVPPSDFVPVLEKYGFIPDLDQYIWEEVCRWIRGCLDKGLPLIPISVNVSRVDIFTMNVAERFSQLAERYQLPRGALKIEITESVCGEDSGRVRAAVQALRERGFVVLMDDFGSGYSSLNMLHELNIDVIKLDAYFLRLDDGSERKGMHILESIVYMAKTLALPIIVEGVETEAQRDYLMSLGCRYVQGYFFYRPMPPADFEALIADPRNVDDQGFIFKANDQFRIREFLNDTIYSDSMLNNIIGPAAIYAQHGDEVDIVRFNQQFFEAVDVPDFQQRMDGIQRFMPAGDAKLMRGLLNQAYEDRLNGASGVMTFYRVDGGFSRFLIHFYFLNESGESRRFYGSARDVTELTNISRHMELLARYSSHTVVFLVQRHGNVAFEIAAHGMEQNLKLTKSRLEAELNSGEFYARVADGDRERLMRLCLDAIHDGKNFSARFTMRAADGADLDMFIKSDYVDDEASDVKCIISLRLADE